jgi:hypothetical protein
VKLLSYECTDPYKTSSLSPENGGTPTQRRTTTEGLHNVSQHEFAGESDADYQGENDHEAADGY